MLIERMLLLMMMMHIATPEIMEQLPGIGSKQISLIFPIPEFLSHPNLQLPLSQKRANLPLQDHLLIHFMMPKGQKTGFRGSFCNFLSIWNGDQTSFWRFWYILVEVCYILCEFWKFHPWNGAGRKFLSLENRFSVPLGYFWHEGRLQFQLKNSQKCPKRHRKKPNKVTKWR